MGDIIVSVVVPIYNSAKTLSKTVESLLNQDFPNESYEIILIDDCSTDGSSDSVSDITAKSQVSIKIITFKTTKVASTQEMKELNPRKGAHSLYRF